MLVRLLGVVTGALAFVALAGVAVAAGSHLDGVQLAHTFLAVVLAAGYIAMDALMLVGKGHDLFTSLICGQEKCLQFRSFSCVERFVLPTVLCYTL